MWHSTDAVIDCRKREDSPARSTRPVTVYVRSRRAFSSHAYPLRPYAEATIRTKTHSRGLPPAIGNIIINRSTITRYKYERYVSELEEFSVFYYRSPSPSDYSYVRFPTGRLIEIRSYFSAVFRNIAHAEQRRIGRHLRPTTQPQNQIDFRGNSNTSREIRKNARRV